jgi:uncharacterized membrane protein
MDAVPQIPSLWRIELLHSALIHFPIACLSLATCAEVLAVLPLPPGCKQALRKISFFLLVIGVPAAWAAVWSGEQAHETVNRVICDPTQTHAHESLALITSWIFTAAVALKIILFIAAQYAPRKYTRVCFLVWFVPLLTSAGTYYLVRTAHLGASLVYLQGAAVYHPTEDCREFE